MESGELFSFIELVLGFMASMEIGNCVVPPEVLGSAGILHFL